MQDSQSLSPGRIWLSRYHVVVTAVGIAALGLALAGPVPVASALLGVLYGLLLPALVLRRYVAKEAPGLHPLAQLMVPLLALVPVWVLILSVLWTISQGVTATAMTATLIVMIVLVTLALLRTVPAGISAVSLPRWPKLDGGWLFFAGAGGGLLVVVLMQMLSH